MDELNESDKVTLHILAMNVAKAQERFIAKRKEMQNAVKAYVKFLNDHNCPISEDLQKIIEED